MAAGNDKAIVEMRGVGLRYPMGPEVLRDINLSLKAGDFYFLTGASGAGKTSLLSLIHLARLPTRGKISLFGRDIEYMSHREQALARRKVGVVFQDYRLLDHLSVMDNISLPLRIMGRSEKYIRAHVPELIEWVGLKDRMDSRPPTLSGGQQQRVAIARAVINNPELLIADEPTGNVDEDMASKLLFLFLELNKMGTAVIIATHSKNLIRQFKFPELRLEGGRLIGGGYV
ncbi:MAG: cell division ATP-binding protein FtsE [Rickettsiales bacterium]|jgi:cell division transport system ATP-binding protein|nr:cell division ATP-binding protein FtsE [Rickettsiales bacterium]